MTEHVLYSFRRCPYAMRARLALAASGTRYELREVRLSDKPMELLSASPKGTVPVLVTVNGAVIDESLAIMRWALTAQDPAGWLMRDDPALIASNDGMFKHHLDRYKYPERHGSAPATHRDGGLRILHDLDGRIAGAGQLCGPLPGLADAAIMPFVRQFAAVDRDWFDAQPLPSLKMWLAGHLASNLFEDIMLRAEPWSSGDQPIIVDRTDKGSPSGKPSHASPGIR
ncbi:glutathione S-transferase [Croceibacterium mercuriale]|uniref:glutathione S-transferase n=1 Tax=Croceibacterium mercuriale TaxID=1572751 RepID=UPI003898D595